MTLSGVTSSTKQTRSRTIAPAINVLIECTPPSWYVDAKFGVQCRRSILCNGVTSWVHRLLNGAYHLLGCGFSTIASIYNFKLLPDSLSRQMLSPLLHKHLSVTMCSLGKWYLHATLKCICCFHSRLHEKFIHEPSYFAWDLMLVANEDGPSYDTPVVSRNNLSIPIKK